MARPFAGVDGRGAEVWVQTGTGTIAALEIGGKGKSANVKIAPEGLKHKINGWIMTDDPLFPEVQAAFDNKEQINYRVESQRKDAALEKDGLDPFTPIADLRKDTSTAAQYTVSIFAGMNGKLTNEAVTDPAKDPSPNGRVRDVSPVAAPAAENAAPSRSGSHATEEPSWKLYNSDGRLNLGSYAVSGTAGAESQVRERAVEIGAVSPLNFGDPQVEQQIMDATRAVLQVADAVQVALPDLRSKVDRNAGSHSRARGIVYDSIKYVPGFLTDDVAVWKEKLQELAVARFVNIVRLTQEIVDDASVINTTPVSQPATASAEPAPVASEQSASGSVADSGDIFPQVSNDPATQGGLASPATVEQFRELVIEALEEQNLDASSNDPAAKQRLVQVGRLVQWTFGTPRAAEVSEENLVAFLDHYTALGTDGFLAAVDKVWALTN